MKCSSIDTMCAAVYTAAADAMPRARRAPEGAKIVGPGWGGAEVLGRAVGPRRGRVGGPGRRAGPEGRAGGPEYKQKYIYICEKHV